MSRVLGRGRRTAHRVWLVGLVSAACLLGGGGVAEAVGGGDPPQRCLRANRHGELPTCTWDGTAWHRSYEGGATAGGGGVAVLFVLVVVAGVALTVWKVSTARRMARDSGMSTRDATAMTLLSDDGFEATYLASNLRGRDAAPPPASPTTSVAERLRELAALRDQALVSIEEHDARRAAILDTL